jgi:LPXTG-motif cell wall-anchored protein
MSRTLVFSGILGAAALLGAGGVSAQVVEDIISIPVDSVLRAPENSVTLVASAPVPAQFQGTNCVAEVEVDNQESEHDGNDLIVASGGTSGVVENFETEAFGVRTVEIPLTLGATVDVSLRMGPDEISSGGVFITVDCSASVPPTTEPPTTEPPTTEPPATVPPESTPETTVPGSPAPTTTVVAAFPPGGGATPPPAAAQPPSGGLPATGPSGTTWAAIAATLLLGAGLGLSRLARQPR